MYQELLDKFQIERKMGYYFAKRFLISTGYSFKLGLNYVDFDTFSLESFLEANNILSFAPVEEVKGTCGIEGANLFPGEESNLYNILEAIAKAETKGCLISDLSNLAGNQVHNYIDRLVGLDILVKRSVLPASGSGPCRISSKSTVVHSKQFAPFYDEASDEVRVVVSSSYLDKIHDLILNVLQQRNVKMVPVRDLARALGMSRWDMQALRNASLAQEKKEPPKVKFFLSNCQSYGPDGILSVPRLAWCVGSASDAAQLLDEGDGKLAFQCSRNMPLHETIALALASRPDGLTASDLRALTGVTLKRAAKLFTAFSKQFGYPVEKVQDGKQLKHKLMPKDPSQAQQQMQRIAHSKTARSAAASHYGIGGAGGIRAVTTVAAAAAHLKTVAASSSASSAPPTSSTTVTATATATACAVTVPAVPDSPEGGAAEDTKKAKGKGQGMVSDMQALNNSIILDFLAKVGSGTLCSHGVHHTSQVD